MKCPKCLEPFRKVCRECGCTKHDVWTQEEIEKNGSVLCTYCDQLYRVREEVTIVLDEVVRPHTV
jgi:uncharacterized protein YbaR (Trm112 family)